jgi:NADH-quinone oxidoreductase subunit M
LGILLGAVYLLRAYQRVFLGPLNPAYSKLQDISIRELATVIPIAFLVLLFGVFPKPLVDMVSSSISSLVSIIQGAM